MTTYIGTTYYGEPLWLTVSTDGTRACGFYTNRGTSDFSFDRATTLGGRIRIPVSEFLAKHLKTIHHQFSFSDEASYLAHLDSHPELFL